MSVSVSRCVRVCARVHMFVRVCVGVALHFVTQGWGDLIIGIIHSSIVGNLNSCETFAPFFECYAKQDWF